MTQVTPDRRILQRLMLPDPDLPHAVEVFVRLSGGSTLDPVGVTLPRAGAALRTDTYANLFNLATWAAQGPVDDLALDLAGTGPVTLHVWQVTDAGDRSLLRADLDLDPQGTALPVAPAASEGLVMWQLTARGAARLTRAEIGARAHGAPVRLAIVITTFRREAAVTATAARIGTLLAAGDLPGAHLYVIDNGQSVSLPEHPHITLIPNRNLGGSGGFARGLAAARAAGRFTHVLFMDDDAACDTQNLTRTTAFLAQARDPATALAGAMVSAARPWQMWENGAVFDGRSRSRFSGTDLRDAGAVTAMELAAPTPPATGFYGAWWYFAFPLAAVTHDPFPFFVRGDDIFFGLTNRFRIATLNGVMSLQDDFAAKASPMTAYLDMRCILLVNLMRPAPRPGPLGILRPVWVHVLHALSHMRYETAAAHLAAWADVMRGPAALLEDLDMSRTRARIAQLTQGEGWRAPPDPLPPLAPEGAEGGWRGLLQRLTLNGHLVPGAPLRGRAVTVPADRRGSLAALRGARRAVILDGAGQAHVLTHSKGRFARLVLRAAGLSLRWLIAWPRLARDWRAASGRFTTPAFWAEQYDDAPAARFADDG